jgi:hypothetical protein
MMITHRADEAPTPVVHANSSILGKQDYKKRQNTKKKVGWRLTNAATTCCDVE